MSKAFKRFLFNFVFAGTTLTLFTLWYWDLKTKELINHLQVHQVKEDIAFRDLVGEMEGIRE
jgi:hypothetical protein